ncbi:MAG: protease modulator HflC [Synergistaceae bacterium]|uniref:protease modulator HflC n=1 Tax=Aminivibrio sp. TaxID=1872489 RepID=UPI001D52EB24|nr:protease modulator HflC [Synergistaceae bacterium]MDD3689651.1 protease modulator HflC [Synergistaceae bacterium]MDD4022159.1 protease modulator HflC [Synergistaceae bacterium]MDD4612765.1 protease modulator HflC [Synergistaceae bacterium]NCC57113.1 protease modulator HflC [Synergistales bacterium]
MKKHLVAIAAVLLLFSLAGSFYIIREDEQAVVLRLGKVTAARTEPGLYFKIPFMDKITVYSKKIVEYDADPVAVVTSDKKNLVFDTIALFMIKEPETFYRRVRTLGSVQQRLDDAIYSAVRIISGRLTLDELVKDKRQQALEQSTAIARAQSREYGVEILSVSYKRVFLPQDNEQAVYRSMQAERNRVAGQLRAEGQAEAITRRSIADRKETEMIARAKRKAEEIKGEGDRTAQETLSKATVDAKDLYLFIKTMDFYQTALPGTPILLRPGEGILKYLKGVGNPPAKNE